MARATKRQIRLLQPFLVGDRAKENGEWDMYCPLHGPEQTRSASVNVDAGVWFCQSCGSGGGLDTLMSMKDTWCDPPSVGLVNGSYRATGQAEVVTNAQVAGWHSALMTNDERIEYLENRCISLDTMTEFEIGWDLTRRVYTIPVRDEHEELLNVRRYDPDPPENRPKIRSVTGMGAPRLYPIQTLLGAQDFIIIGEGEWDVLATIQQGFPAVTRTAAADVWRSEWSEHFKDLRVFLAHDLDEKGAIANKKVARALQRIAAEIRVINLPFPFKKNHGHDLTDFWKQCDKEDFQELLASAELWGAKSAEEVETVSVMDSVDASRVGKTVRMAVTIKGRREPGYTVPLESQLSCSRDAGGKCNFCPLFGAGGEALFRIDPHSPRILAMLDVNNATVSQVVAAEYGVPTGKCQRLIMEHVSHQSVEILVARPALDATAGNKASDYKTTKLTSVGRHDTLPNNTVDVIGALYANPRTQTNEFLAWDMHRTETSVDHFEVTPEVIRLMRVFQTQGAPLKKLRDIADQMSAHVTRIIGRPEMHALMDLTFHSVLAFNFAGKLETRGWLDTLIIGDTRTGKSEAASGLARHYAAGEVITGEMATVAGMIGGAQQIGGKDWLITWGIIPLNDQRLVVIDEASGLSYEDISAMSDVRASGVARITKIVSEATFARTRLLWLSNPRNARMSDFTYGVDAIRPLVGNNEDIARYDLAMGVTVHDVPAETINREQQAASPLLYSAEACHALVLWAWTRKPDQIIWVDDAESAVMRAANAMGRRYVEDPPLVQAANIRLKIARTAVALAARLFSTDVGGENLLVHPKHVAGAVTFIDRLYSMGTFGYAERSKERIEDLEEAKENVDDIKRYLEEMPGLAKFLRGHASFRRQDLEEILDIDRSEANATINRLWEARMVRKEQANVKVESVLHQLLREMA